MRGIISLTTVVIAATAAVVGCAGQPSTPQAQSSAAQAPSAAATAPAATAADIETQRLAAAKNLNLKVINKDGQQLFCRSNLITGSHIQRDTRCFTAAQVDQMDQAVQREVEQFIQRPYDTQNPAKLPGSK
jgi:hypothetical protein